MTGETDPQHLQIPLAVLVLTMTASPAQAKEVQGTSGPDTLFGTSGNDRAYGYAGGDYIEVLRLRDCQQGYNVLVEGIIA